MTYIENPKTKGSGIYCAIPHEETCKVGCKDCFFTNGRSYLEPLSENLPNMPDREIQFHNVIRVNDGHDSSMNIVNVIEKSSKYLLKFYNTCFMHLIDKFDDPVVLTVNAAEMTDNSFLTILDSFNQVPKNLMMVRVRVNTWNLEVVRNAVQYYGDLEIPIILTFLAYDKTVDEMPLMYQNQHYIKRVRTINEYYAITTQSWRHIMNYWKDTKYEKWVYSCGKIEGEHGTTACLRCGNCVREYHNTMERMRND